MLVIKLNGSKEEFDREKIHKAVQSAFSSCSKDMSKSDHTKLDKCIDSLLSDLSEDEVDIDITKIQDLVERFLIKNNYYEVARSYIIYRHLKEVQKEENNRLIHGITEKLNASNVANQNANVDEKSFGGRVGEASRIVTKDYALNYCMSKKSKENHLGNMVYIHDLDSWAIGNHNCLSVPFDDLLKDGFVTRQVDIRPAKSINTAFQLLAVIFQIQSLQQFGGVSATHLDHTMVPYVKKSFFKHYFIEYLKRNQLFGELDLISLSEEELDDLIDEKKSEFLSAIGLTEEEVVVDNKEKLQEDLYQGALFDTRRELYQAVEGMYHNLNSLQSRSGNQLPFTSINYGTCTLTEGRMVIKALLEGSIKGVGRLHKTSVFPCGIFQYMKGVNDKPGTPNYDMYQLALKSTSKRLYPNYANVDWTGNAGYDINDPRTYFSTMGCHAKGTKIIMADNTRKNVEDIVVGDKLAGVNNDIRVVEKLIHGIGKMYKVEQSEGDTYIVNDGHILALEYSGNEEYMGYKKGDKVNIRINDLLSIPEDIRKFFKGYKVDQVLSTLEITELPEDEFFGFELDGDRLYLLGDYTVTHNCRTANGFDINGFGQLKDGRGNICPVTVILPTLAMEAGRDVEKFMRLLGKKIEEAKDTLIERFNWICSQPVESARFMYENNTMKGYIPEEGIVSALKHGTLALGQLGLAETLRLLIGVDQTTVEGMKLAKRIESLFKKRCAEYKEKYKLNFGVYYTPAENLCYTALTKFRDKYGVIEGVSDNDFFTNSMHVSVWVDVDPFQKIDIESQLTPYSSAGCITYVELPASTINNLEALETLVNYAMDHDIPYFAVNVPNDTCNECGTTGDFRGDICPVCGSKDIKRLRRVTGYLSDDYRNFNPGKIDEVLKRTKHVKN